MTAGHLYVAWCALLVLVWATLTVWGLSVGTKDNKTRLYRLGRLVGRLALGFVVLAIIIHP